MSRRTHHQPQPQPQRRARRSSILACWIAVLIPLLGGQASRVYYHCQITGELLPVCCCERADTPAPSSPEPPCCTREAEQSEFRSAGLVDRDCDCCDVHYQQARRGIDACAVSKTVACEVSLGSPVPVRRLDSPHAITSFAPEPGWRVPPRRPLYILFESFRS